jgi:hypothetical protein
MTFICRICDEQQTAHLRRHMGPQLPFRDVPIGATPGELAQRHGFSEWLDIDYLRVLDYHDQVYINTMQSMHGINMTDLNRI